jgi:hypothetical protein
VVAQDVARANTSQESQEQQQPPSLDVSVSVRLDQQEEGSKAELAQQGGSATLQTKQVNQQGGSTTPHSKQADQQEGCMATQSQQVNQQGGSTTPQSQQADQHEGCMDTQSQQADQEEEDRTTDQQEALNIHRAYTQMRNVLRRVYTNAKMASETQQIDQQKEASMEEASKEKDRTTDQQEALEIHRAYYARIADMVQGVYTNATKTGEKEQIDQQKEVSTEETSKSTQEEASESAQEETNKSTQDKASTKETSQVEKQGGASMLANDSEVATYHAQTVGQAMQACKVDHANNDRFWKSMWCSIRVESSSSPTGWVLTEDSKLLHEAVRNAHFMYGLNGLNALLASREATPAMVCCILDKFKSSHKFWTGKTFEYSTNVYASKDQAKRLAICFELSQLPGFPPVGLEWEDMVDFCDLCEAMPGILTSKTGLVFFNNLYDKIEYLCRLPGKQLSRYPCGNQHETATYDVDVLCGVERFVVLASEHAKHLVQVLPGQQVRRTDVFDAVKHKVLASIDGPFDKNRTTKYGLELQASPDDKFILWVHNIADQNKAPFVVIDATCGSKIEACQYFSTTHVVWWAGQNVLGARREFALAWQSFDLSELQTVPTALSFTHYGNMGVQNAKYRVSILQASNTLTVCTTSIDGGWYWSEHEGKKGSRVVGHPHDEDLFYIVDKDVSSCYEFNVQQRFDHQTWGLSEISKKELNRALARDVWTMPTK